MSLFGRIQGKILKCILRRELTSPSIIEELSGCTLKYDPKGTIFERTVSTYENQRWWIGLNWQPHLFTTERGLWSDQSGSIYLPKEAFILPRGWRWVENCWERVVGPDWEYGDTDWRMTNVVRRRKWKRKMVLDLNQTNYPDLMLLVEKMKQNKVK
ncbi:hypothetical protein ROZALSC1DRAFT_28408, partial [Rozella allomycis CSF55]